jgi:predicted oxidoreductase
MGKRDVSRLLCVIALAALAAGCARPAPESDADVIVVGAGIAGLAAALEAADAGATALVLDANSVAGGHAMMAGGLFLVGTPLQASKGVEDSPDLAFADIMKWGEDANPEWVRRYVTASRTEVHDWLVALGVEFRMLLPAPGETSVPRFHFARGSAAGVVTPMMRKAFAQDGLRFAFNTEATGLGRTEDGRWRVTVRDLRDGTTASYVAPAVVLATGGFENDLGRVRAHWLPGVAQPERLLMGAGRFARGDGLDLGREAGARIERLDHQTIYVTGLPDPRDPQGEHGLLAQNDAAIFVDAGGRRFINERAPRKDQERTILAMPGQGYWMLFDAAGARELRVRGAPWLTPEALGREILANPALVARADTVAGLAGAAGLPAVALEEAVRRFNAQVRAGRDDDFGRFGPGVAGAPPQPLEQAPYYAMRLYPMTRKSLGGLAIDAQARVVGEDGAPLAGLFAAGEATGVAGINGSVGGSGTFLGPSILTGRIAGGAAAAHAQASGRTVATPGAGEAGTPTAGANLDAAALKSLLASPRPGFWHFEVAHSLVMERGTACAACHGGAWPTGPARGRPARLAQLDSCASCH